MQAESWLQSPPSCLIADRYCASGVRLLCLSEFQRALLSLVPFKNFVKYEPNNIQLFGFCLQPISSHRVDIYMSDAHF